jgi:allantoate deiminase
MTRAASVIKRCRALATMSETSDGLLRTFLSPPMRDAHRLLTQWMEAAGMRVNVDAAGNLRGVYPASHEPSRRLLLGSHLDTVPNAGAFDGVLGIVLAIALVEELRGRKLPFSIEIAAFSDEEGVRFGIPFLGSRALAGSLDAATLESRDASGISVADAIRAFGLDPSRLPEASLNPTVFAYVEFHIEQGPALESLDLPLGVVTSIAGQSRSTVVFRGQPNHAATTPMALRRDALTVAARWIGAVERHARAVDGLVATVGSLDVRPGADNCIPGEVRASLDIRHPDDLIRRASTGALLRAAHMAGERRGIGVECRYRTDQSAVYCDPALVGAMSRAVAAAGFPVNLMPSGAGHDGMILAARAPISMLFLRSPGGLSHHPDEAVNVCDVDAALSAGFALLGELETTQP